MTNEELIEDYTEEIANAGLRQEPHDFARRTGLQDELLRRLAASQPGEPGKAQCPKCGGPVVLRHVLSSCPSFCAVQCSRCMPNGTWMINSADDLAQFFGPSAPSPLPCEGCNTQSLDAFEHDGCFVDKVVDREQARWQKSLYDLSRKHAIAPNEIDGSGCDSGDPLDLTLAEVGQVICQLENPQDYRVAPSGSAGPERALCRNCQAVHEVGGNCPSGGTKHSRAESAAEAKEKNL